MNKLFIFLAMIFCHIADDYYLQGWLASAKQKKYWQETAPDKMYKYDYIWALIMHAFSWTFMMMLPITISLQFNLNFIFGLIFIANVVLHAQIDDLKANKKWINLWVDQIFHLVQIISTFLIFISGAFSC